MQHASTLSQFLVRSLVVIAFLLVSACTIKYLYNNLDYLIPEYVEGMVSLDDMLEERLEQRTELLLEWHRSTQLKQYANWVSELQENILRNPTEENIVARFNDMEIFWQSLRYKINDEMALLLPLLDEYQREELFSNIGDNNEDFHEDYVDIKDEERLENYIETLHDHVDFWFGSYTAEQEPMIKYTATQLQSSAKLRLESRLRWQHGIRSILETSASRTDKQEHLKLFLDQFTENVDPEIRRISRHNQRAIAHLAVKIATSMSPEQKHYFIDETNDYIRMFTELSEGRRTGIQ